MIQQGESVLAHPSAGDAFLRSGNASSNSQPSPLLTVRVAD